MSVVVLVGSTGADAATANTDAKTTTSFILF
jgi:hypothetical protein